MIRSLTSAEVEQFAKETRHRFGNAMDAFVLSHSSHPVFGHLITLCQLKVDRWYRGRGVGSAAMWALVAFADYHGAAIALTAGSRPGIFDWYRKFGFYRPDGQYRNMRRLPYMTSVPRRQRKPEAIY